MSLDKDSRIFVAGHRGMVGSAIVRKLRQQGFARLIVAGRNELDLRNPTAVQAFIAKAAPDWIIVAAAKVGGIHANDAYPADFLHDNLMIECNLLRSAFENDIQQVLFLGSSCIYPRDAAQPIKESELLNGYLESTNEAYAIAKIAGIKLCESYNRQHGTDYRSLMPTNLYGPNDNFHASNSHVIPALLRRIHEAKNTGSATVDIWGSGKPRREFLHVDDLAAAVCFIIGLDRWIYWDQLDARLSHINVGTGKDVAIRELAETLVRVIGYRGKISFDTSKPDGTPRKLLDVSKLRSMGWQATIDLEQGLRDTYQWYLENEEKLRGVSP